MIEMESRKMNNEYTTEKLEMRDFINVGLRDVQRGALSDFDVAFDRLEKRYQEQEAAI